MGQVVLVTGVSRDLGRRFARAAADDPSVDRVIGVDVVPPRGDIGDVEFVRADIRNPVIAKVIAKEDVDTVVHTSVIATPGSAGGRTTMKELNVIGTMQLLAACQKAPTRQAPRREVDRRGLRRHPPRPRDVHRGDGAPSGCPPRASPRTRRGRGLRARLRPPPSRRRGDDAPRAPTSSGPHIAARSPPTSGCRSIPTVLGYDARLQFLHEDDVLDVLAARGVTGDDRHLQRRRRRVLMLSQAVRRLGTPSRPDARLRGRPPRLGSAPGPARRLLARADGVPDLRSGRGHHPDAHELGFEPAFTTAEAFADFAVSLRRGRTASGRPRQA